MSDDSSDLRLAGWVQSLRPGFDSGIDDTTWVAVMGEPRRIVSLEIGAHGAFAAEKDSGLVIARTWAT
jgi:hypothetical protein